MSSNVFFHNLVIFYCIDYSATPILSYPEPQMATAVNLSPPLRQSGSGRFLLEYTSMYVFP